jgi:hypothetical protein
MQTSVTPPAVSDGRQISDTGGMVKPGGEETKQCFLIAPIGEEGSETRRRSDQMLRYIINPILQECGYGNATRPDHLGKPGLIVPAVIERVMEDPLVIADLSDRDPIVYYLLAVRHMARRPIVKMIDAAQPSPFDVAQSRIIRVDTHDLDSVEYSRGELRKQIRAAEKKPQDLDNPITNYVDLTHLRQSADPEKQYWAQLFERIHEMQISLEAVLRRFQSLDSLRFVDGAKSVASNDQPAVKREETDSKQRRVPDLGDVDISKLTSMLTEVAREFPKGGR